MKKVPNPKHNLTTDKPEIPVCAVNSTNYSIGRQYARGKNGKESCFTFIERKGIRKYITETVFDAILKQEFENAYRMRFFDG